MFSFKRGLRIAAFVFGMVVAGIVGWSAPADAADQPPVDEHQDHILTQEHDCFEIGDRRPVLFTEADAYVPDRYAVVPMAAPAPPAWTGAPGAIVASVGFQDYFCKGLSVNGHAELATIVSLGVVAVRRDGIPATYILWVGTDNPLLFARLQQVGVETFFIPQSTYLETTNQLGQREIVVGYVSRGPGGLDYTRVLTVVTEPPLAPISTIGTFYHLGTRGEVRFSYANLVDSAARARICFDVGDDSLPIEYGITDFCFPAQRTFFRGSWQGKIELLP